MKQIHSIDQIRAQARVSPFLSSLWTQVEKTIQRQTSSGKPFIELRLRDATGLLTLRAWSDAPAFAITQGLACGDAVEIEGEFYDNGNFGLDARNWKIRRLDPDESEVLFRGNEEAEALADRDFDYLIHLVSSLHDPRLKALAERFFVEFGARFRRAAAARFNHHARRGGLCQHVAQMARSADALCHVYPQLNRDLLLTGVLFHDCGKLWECCPGERSFEIERNYRAEMLGHINLGIELANRLWRELEPQFPLWAGIHPPTDLVRWHLLHLIASHHGELQFGSPIEPKIPEAFALHYIDNLDARLEMVFAAYGTATEIAPKIFDRVRPLPGTIIEQLPKCDLQHFEQPKLELEENGGEQNVEGDSIS